ncbi:MAG: helix-turn-helix transcriptional regulator [Bacteroides sp.]
MILMQRKRLEKGWSKRELSRRAGIDAALISYAENRGFRLYPGQLSKVATAFGIAEDDAGTLLEEVGVEPCRQ